MSNPLCDLDLNLKALEDKKAELNAQMAELAQNGQAGMTDLIAKAEAQKEQLLKSLPKIPEVPNFQAVLTDLVVEAALAAATSATGVGAVAGVVRLHKKVMDVKKKWGPAIEGIDKILDNFIDPKKLLDIGNFDICNQPNVDGKPNPDGSFAPIPKPITSKVQVENAEAIKEPEPKPKKAEEVVIEVEKKVNPSDITVIQKFEAKGKIDDELYKIFKPLKKKIQKLNKRLNQLKKSKTIKSANEAKGIKEFKDRYDGKAKAFEYYVLEDVNIPKLYDEYIESYVKRNAYNEDKII